MTVVSMDAGHHPKEEPVRACVTIEKAWATWVMGGHCPAEFSSNPDKKIQ